MKSLIAAAAALAAATLAGCASRKASDPGTPIPRREIVAVGDGFAHIEPSAARTRTAELGLSADRAWALLPIAYQSLGLSATTIDAQGRRLGAEGQRVQGRLKGVWLSRYVDCGTAATGIANADSYTVTLAVTSQVHEPTDNAGAEVSTVVKAVGRATSVGSNTPINCPSRGSLERQIAELVRQEATKAP